NVLPVDQDATLLRLELAAQEPNQRRLARARRTYKSDALARPDVEIEILEHLKSVRMAEAHLLELNTPARDDERPRRRRLDDLVWLADKVERLCKRPQLLEVIEHPEGELLHARSDLIGEQVDHRESAEQDGAAQHVARRHKDERDQQQKSCRLHEG